MPLARPLFVLHERGIRSDGDNTTWRVVHESDIVIWAKRIATSENGDYNRETTTTTMTRRRDDTQTEIHEKFLDPEEQFRERDKETGRDVGRKEKEEKNKSFSLSLLGAKYSACNVSRDDQTH